MHGLLKTRNPGISLPTRHGWRLPELKLECCCSIAASDSLTRHNAHEDYYLLRNTAAGAGDELPKDLRIWIWGGGRRGAEHLTFFAKQGRHQILCTYDDTPIIRQQYELFDIASVAKAVCTAMAVGIREDRGLLDHDAPVTRYLADHRGRGVDQMTLRRLASHTSEFHNDPRVSDGGIKGDAIFERMLTENPKWPVNTRFEYACRNIILLSTMVERVTGDSFNDFCQKEIFEPLQMHESAFNRVASSERVVATHHPVLGENHSAEGRDDGPGQVLGSGEEGHSRDGRPNRLGL